MPILQHWRGVWQRAKEYAVGDDFPTETAATVNRFAEEAYKYCVHLYGLPKNAKKGYKVVQGERSFYAPFTTPTITISRELESQEYLCETVAHEMYHRVTEGRKGIGSELWVKEMMASLTSYWFLNNQGFQEYVKTSRKALLARESAADMHLLKSSTSGTRRYILSGVPIYSEAFRDSVWRIGYALHRAVKGNDLCTLIKFGALEAWTASLPAEDQYTVCRVLALPAKDKAIPSGNRELGNLFLALQATGNKKALVEEFEHLVHLQPANSTAFFYLGYALQVSKRFEDAIGAYMKAQRLGYTDKWLMNNMGSLYWKTQDYVSAAEWYQKAVEQIPDWAQARYWLGRSLNNLGNITGARQNWEIVATLADKHHAKLAQTALMENTVPNTVDEN